MQKTLLHVGCGPYSRKRLHAVFHGPEWREIRLDIDASVKPDLIGTMTDMSVVPSGSMDALWSSHNIEHLEAHEVPVALAEFRRVLRPGGFALIVTPDLQEICRHVAEGRLEDLLYESSAGPISAIDTLYGLRTAIARGNSFMAHRTGFVAATLKQKLKDAGFEHIGMKRDLRTFNLWALAVHGQPDPDDLALIARYL